jgi:peroxiredoxin
MSALPPATLDGWFALHQVLAQDWAALHRLTGAERKRVAEEARVVLSELANPSVPGWSAGFRLIGGRADWLLIHFRETPDQLADAQLRLRRSALGPFLRVEYDYVSVAEASMYHATVEAARQAEPGSDEFKKVLDELIAAELAVPHVQARLRPANRTDMPYACFYPMSRRRAHPDNWYTLPAEERARLMREHGLSGRRYADRVYQVISASVGLDDWEWGVTLFAFDLLDFKRIVGEMRFDEASARYGEFGPFYVGIRMTPEEWAQALLPA